MNKTQRVTFRLDPQIADRFRRVLKANPALNKSGVMNNALAWWLDQRQRKEEQDAN